MINKYFRATLFPVEEGRHFFIELKYLKVLIIILLERISFSKYLYFESNSSLTTSII